MAIGVCLLGCGRIGREHARAWRRQEGVRLWTCDAVAGRAAQMAFEMGAEGDVGDYAAALADSDIALVDVCLPHDQHVEAAVRAARAGKHLLIEKPLTRTVAEADTLLAETARAGVQCMVAECYRYAPTVLRAVAAIAAGDVGDVFLVQVNTLQRHHPVPGDFRAKRSMMGGGVLIDRGIHFVDVLHQLGGDIDAVSALDARGGISELEGEDTACLLVRFASGGVGQLSVSWGTWRAATASGPDWMVGQPPAAWFTVFGTKGTLYDHDGLHLITEEGRGPRQLAPASPDPPLIELEIADYAAALRAGRPAPVPAAVGRRDLAVVEAAYESMASGSVVRLRQP